MTESSGLPNSWTFGCTQTTNSVYMRGKRCLLGSDDYKGGKQHASNIKSWKTRRVELITSFNFFLNLLGMKRLILWKWTENHWSYNKSHAHSPPQACSIPDPKIQEIQHPPDDEASLLAPTTHIHRTGPGIRDWLPLTLLLYYVICSSHRPPLWQGLYDKKCCFYSNRIK